MKCLVACVFACGLVIGGLVGQAEASTVLLDLRRPADQGGTSYALTFLATDPETTLTIAGYNVRDYEYVYDLSLTLTDGGPDLLGGSWVFTPAAFGSDSSTYDDGYETGIPALYFGGTVVRDFDEYAQTFSTVPGDSYTLDFLYSNVDRPARLLVAVDPLPEPVPEPGGLALLGSGLVGLTAGYVRRRPHN